MPSSSNPNQPPTGHNSNVGCVPLKESWIYLKELYEDVTQHFLYPLIHGPDDVEANDRDVRRPAPRELSPVPSPQARMPLPQPAPKPAPPRAHLPRSQPNILGQPASEPAPILVLRPIAGSNFHPGGNEPGGNSGPQLWISLVNPKNVEWVPCRVPGPTAVSEAPPVPDLVSSSPSSASSYVSLPAPQTPSSSSPILSPSIASMSSGEVVEATAMGIMQLNSPMMVPSWPASPPESYLGQHDDPEELGEPFSRPLTPLQSESPSLRQRSASRSSRSTFSLLEEHLSKDTAQAQAPWSTTAENHSANSVTGHGICPPPSTPVDPETNTAPAFQVLEDSDIFIVGTEADYESLDE